MIHEVKEFRNLEELNNFLVRPTRPKCDIIPIAKMFEHPTTKLLTSVTSYVVILYD